MKRSIISIMGILAVSALIFTGCGDKSTVSKVGTAPDGSEVAIEKATVKYMNDTVKGGYKTISTEELSTWVKDKKDMIIIDTMPADNFAKGHIPGALNAELPKTGIADATDEQKEAFLELLGDDKSKTVVVYCGFVGCARSDVGSVLAKEAGFEEVYRVPGGGVAWEEAGYEVEK